MAMPWVAGFKPGKFKIKHLLLTHLIERFMFFSLSVESPEYAIHGASNF